MSDVPNPLIWRGKPSLVYVSHYSLFLLISCLFPLLWPVAILFILGMAIKLGCIRYSFFQDRIVIEEGVLDTKTTTIPTYRVKDIELKKMVGDRIAGVGTLHFITSDKVQPDFEFLCIEKADELQQIFLNIIQGRRHEEGVKELDFYNMGEATNL